MCVCCAGFLCVSVCVVWEVCVCVCVWGGSVHLVCVVVCVCCAGFLCDSVCVVWEVCVCVCVGWECSPSMCGGGDYSGGLKRL